MRTEIKGALTAIALLAPFVFPGQAGAGAFALEGNQRVIVDPFCSTDGEGLLTVDLQIDTRGGGASVPVTDILSFDCDFLLHAPGTGAPVFATNNNGTTTNDGDPGEYLALCSKNICDDLSEPPVENSAVVRGTVTVNNDNGSVNVPFSCGVNVPNDLNSADMCPSGGP
jgi:hypothetical protein